MKSVKSFRCYHGAYRPARKPLVPLERPVVKIPGERLFPIFFIKEDTVCPVVVKKIVIYEESIGKINNG